MMTSKSILLTLTFGSVLLNGVVDAYSTDISKTGDKNWQIFGWKVDVVKDQEFRSRNNVPQYDSSCPTGHYRKDGICIWSPPKVVQVREGFCPFGYDYKDKQCYQLGDFDPFFNFFTDKKWWQVDTEKDSMYRKRRGFSSYSTNCRIGYGLVDDKCQWFVPIMLKPISDACPATYVFIDNTCQWNGSKGQDMFPYKISLASAQAVAIERKIFDGLLNGRRITDDSWNTTSTSSSSSNQTSRSFTFNGQFKCTGKVSKMVQGNPVTVKITNDITNDRSFELCTFNEIGTVEFTGYTFSNQKREFEFPSHTGRSYQIRLWSGLGRCTGGVVSRTMSFQKSGQFTLKNMLGSCL